MDDLRWKRFLKSDLWVSWWKYTLYTRPCKLIDVGTGRALNIKQRIKMEKPKFDDLVSFLSDFGLKITISNKIVGKDDSTVETTWRCTAESKNLYINRFSDVSVRDVVESVVLDFLKEVKYS